MTAADRDVGPVEDWFADDPIPFELRDQPDPAAEGSQGPVVPLCPDVESWVRDVYAATFVRKITQTQRWCPSWWAHAEAVVRLETLWRTWEVARVAEHPDAMADWLRSTLDLINPVLLSPDGPFAGCTPDRHTDPTPMPLLPAPPDWWATHPTDPTAELQGGRGDG